MNVAKSEASLLDAYKLIHNGTIALSQVEHNGIRIDVDYLKQAEKDVSDRIRQSRLELQSHKVYRLQARRFGAKTNLSSRPQLAKVLSLDMGVELPTTEKNRQRLDESVLQSLDLDYCQKFIEHEKLVKLRSTYINGVLSEVVDGYLHPVTNLHLVTTYRSSYSNPNFQNIPIRDDAVAKIIRRAVIPRDDHVLIEIDYSALEFRIAACAYRDPAMVEYASNPKKDIHRDCASKIFMAKRDEVNKQSRQVAKNKFVFPQIFGDYYVQCAQNCWGDMESFNLVVGDISMQKHLRSNGISELGRCSHNDPPLPGTFESHMKQVEKWFYSQFPVLKDKRDTLWKTYQKTGEVKLMTGFVIKGVYKRNFILNCIIQGPAFHLVLWSLIQLVKWSRKKRTKIIAEIHDSILADVHKSELEEYLRTAKQIMTERVKDQFDWVITPLGVEAVICENNWYEKKGVDL